MTELFFKNFGLIWERFLNFEINRSREAIEYFGNANSYFILQTIAWHNIYLILKEDGFRDYDRMKKQWGEKLLEFEQAIPDKLTILAVSQISGIEKETTRRTINNLISDGWITYSRKEGVRYHPKEKNNQQMINFNETIEIPLFLKLTASIKKLT